MSVTILIFLILNFLLLGFMILGFILTFREGNDKKSKKIHILENEVNSYKTTLGATQKELFEHKAKHDITAKYRIKQNVLVKKPDDKGVSSAVVRYIKQTEKGVVYGLVHPYLDNYEVEEKYIYPDTTLL